MSTAGIIVLTIIGCIILFDILWISYEFWTEYKRRKRFDILNDFNYSHSLGGYRVNYNRDESYALIPIRRRLSDLEDLADKHGDEIGGLDNRLDELEARVKELEKKADFNRCSIGSHLDDLEARVKELENGEDE